MTDKETMEILLMLEANYQPFKDVRTAVALWAECFRDDDYQLVRSAVLTIIQSDRSEFRPNVAKVRKVMHDIVYGDMPTETEAWLTVKNAMHEAQEEPETLGGAWRAWRKLPESLQRLVTPRQLFDWNSVESEKLDTVIQSNFLRSYRDVSDQYYRKEAITASLNAGNSRLQLAYGKVEPKPELPEPVKITAEEIESVKHELSERAKELLEKFKDGRDDL